MRQDQDMQQFRPTQLAGHELMFCRDESKLD